MMFANPEIYAEYLKTKSDDEIINEKDMLLDNITGKYEKNHPLRSAYVRNIKQEYLLCVLKEIQNRHLEKMVVTDNLVEMGINNYIPFEPKYASTEMKNRAILRAAARQLKGNEKEILLAEFGNFSGKDWFYDLENILFYNIGTAYFKSACKYGLAFSELHSNSIYGTNFLYRYKMVNINDLPDTKEVVVEWNNIEFEKINSSLKPIDYWKTFKKNWDKVNITKAKKISSEFGIRIDVNLSREKEINIAAVMKPMLDGIICAFHPADRDLSSFCKELCCSESQLIGDDKCVLLPREYIYHYRGGLKWNPEDDKCKSVLITVSQGNGKDTLIGGHIFQSGVKQDDGS